MSTGLIALACGDLRIAKRFLDNDVLMRRHSAFHTQQAIEKAVMHCLKLLGRSYTKATCISDLLARFPNDQSILSDEWLDWLEENSDLLYRWENEALWELAFEVSREQLLSLYEKAQELCDLILRASEDGGTEV